MSDSRECAVATAPASTFKIPHALIALQTGVVTPATVVKWDGTPRDFETWRRDHTLESSIRWSVYPFFQHTARLIGRDRMKQSLGSLAYAADTFDGELTTFWNTGDLVVTPIEQVAFLRRLVAGKLPIDARHVATVRQALRMPAGQITNAAGTHSFALTWPKSASRAREDRQHHGQRRARELARRLGDARRRRHRVRRAHPREGHAGEHRRR